MEWGRREKGKKKEKGEKWGKRNKGEKKERRTRGYFYLLSTFAPDLCTFVHKTSAQTASMLLLKSGGTHVEFPPIARRRVALRRHPG